MWKVVHLQGIEHLAKNKENGVYFSRGEHREEVLDPTQEFKVSFLKAS